MINLQSLRWNPVIAAVQLLLLLCCSLSSSVMTMLNTSGEPGKAISRNFLPLVIKQQAVRHSEKQLYVMVKQHFKCQFGCAGLCISCLRSWNDWLKLTFESSLRWMTLTQFRKSLAVSYTQKLIKSAAPFLFVCVWISTQAQSPYVMSFKACSQDGNRCRQGFLVRFAKDYTTLPFRPAEIQGRLWFGSTSSCKPLLCCWCDTSAIKKYSSSVYVKEGVGKPSSVCILLEPSQCSMSLLWYCHIALSFLIFTCASSSLAFTHKHYGACECLSLKSRVDWEGYG